MRVSIAGVFSLLLIAACAPTPRTGLASPDNSAPAAPSHAAAATQNTDDRQLAMLLEYQGRYEYDNGSVLEIAASPVDRSLYALLGGARYRLKSAGDDVFVNAANQRVLFQRDSTGKARQIIGYQQPDSGNLRLYRRLPGELNYPPQMWYPRLPGLSINYTAPVLKSDGLAVAPVAQSTLDAARLNDMIHHLAGGQYPDVHSVLIVKDDHLVLEEYFYEHDANTLHPLRSATKSIVALLAGIAIDRQLLPGVDTPVWPYFRDDYPTIQFPDERKQRITLKHLLTQSAGLDCNDWDSASKGNESRIAETDDWVKSFWDLPVLHEPGRVASYCSNGVIALGRVIEKAAGMPLPKFAERVLFAPLGIKHYDWRFAPDRSSAYTFTQISLTSRDMTKIGLLMLHQGRWQGQQVVSADWVRAATSKQVQLDDTDYGYLWWLPYLNTPSGRQHAIMATGNGGQKIMLWPALNMVTVLTGGNYNSSSPSNKLLISYILPAK